MVLGGVVAGHVQADPADDALAKLNELSRQAEQTTEAMHSAQLDLNNKLAVQQAADAKHTADAAAVESTKSQLATFQSSVDKLAAAQYMGGRTDGMDAMLTATSPQGLIDQLAVQRVMAAEMSAQMKSYRDIGQQAALAEDASANSAAEAKTAAEQAAMPPPPAPPAPDALPPADDPGVLAAPPGGIPPGDMAPPGGIQGGGAPEAAAVIQAALSRIGSPYSWGGSGPNAFDCSGLVMWSFQQAGIALPHSSQALAQGGQPVAQDQMQPGDLVTYYSDASHVAIYIGDGMMVHASTYGTPVRVAPVDNAPIFNIRRY
jgi:cell wall-associated NlpC family hydrolase